MGNRLAIVAAASLCCSGVLTAQSAAPASGQSSAVAKATTTVSNLPGDGAVKGDTQPKPNPSGQNASDYKPKQSPVKAKEPPSPPPKK